MTRPNLPNWWLRQAAPFEPVTPLEGERRADVLIVGGGFTGLWTALRIKEHDPGAEVVLLEADLCGSGASGRNGGFALSSWHHFIGLQQICGDEEAVRLCHASDAAVQSIGEFCVRHGIDAHFQCEGWFWTATSAAQVGAWSSTVEALARHDEHPFKEIDRDSLARRTGSPAHIAGVFEPGLATLQPALLARGLRRVVLDQGVAVFERSPMTSLERSRPLVARTPSGRVSADRVVIATGAWAAAMRELRNAFVVVASDIVLSAPVSEELRDAGWVEPVGISDSRLMVHYYRTTRDGRIAFGKGGGRLAFGGRIGESFNGRSPIESSLTVELRGIYPFLATTPVTTSWAGPIDRTIDGFPFFCSLGRDDLIVGVGYSGNGVGPSALGGRILASLALGLRDEWSSCGLVRRPPRGMPPEPFRYVGGSLVRRAVGRKERAEDLGRRPSRIDLALARLAPAGLVPVD